MDIIAEMQHRNRNAIHDLRGISSLAKGRIHLIERDGVNEEKVLMTLRTIVHKCTELEKKLTS